MTLHNGCCVATGPVSQTHGVKLTLTVNTIVRYLICTLPTSIQEGETGV